MFFYYDAISAGRVIPKYKVRLIKMKYIEPEGAKRHDWIAYSAEWSEDSRTYVGQFVKKFYLDELPQFYSVLMGDMSVVAQHLHQLIYRRVLGGASRSKSAEQREKMNSATSPFLWGLSLIAIVPAVLFWNKTEWLVAFTMVFVLIYLWLYRSIVRFSVPRWLRRLGKAVAGGQSLVDRTPTLDQAQSRDR